jgi:sigma-E factor negative regulatory protein RseC
MIEENAVVVHVHEDRVVLEAAVKSTCSGCQAKNQCGTGSIARVFSHKVQKLELLSPMPVNVGDTVVIGIQESGVLYASFLLYLFPLLTFFIALLTASWLTKNDTHELWLFALALVPTAIVFRLVSAKCVRLDKGRFQPVILRRLLS